MSARNKMKICHSLNELINTGEPPAKIQRGNNPHATWCMHWKEHLLGTQKKQGFIDELHVKKCNESFSNGLTAMMAGSPLEVHAVAYGIYATCRIACKRAKNIDSFSTRNGDFIVKCLRSVPGADKIEIYFHSTRDNIACFARGLVEAYSSSSPAWVCFCGLQGKLQCSPQKLTTAKLYGYAIS